MPKMRSHDLLENSKVWGYFIKSSTWRISYHSNTLMPIIIDSVNMLEDVIFLDIDNIVPSWDTYCFALDIHSLGCKRVVLHFKDAQILQLKNGKDEEDNSPLAEEGTVAKASEDDEELVVKTWEKESVVQTSEDEEEELVVPVPIPLRLRNPNPDPGNPTAPWCYYMHPIDETHLSAKAGKRYAEEELQERFKKPRLNLEELSFEMR
ncbi:hypothetical protein BDR06DRAFT_978172, partial [Suillus hirtellus]